MFPDHFGSDADYEAAMGHLDQPEPEPAIELTVDWPGESVRERFTRWAPVFDVIDRFAHVRRARITVTCDDPDGDTEVRIQYRPNRSEIAFHAGRWSA
jgi:hypothetical protein